MADEFTGTKNFGATKEHETPEARDLVADPLTDEEQGNEDIHKPTETPDVPDQHVEEGEGGIDNPRGDSSAPGAS